MRNEKLLVLLMSVGCLAFAHGWAQSVPETNVSERCASLAKVDFTGTPDASTRITATQLVAASDDVPGYCDVQGVISPNIGFVLGLPTLQWNGKLLQIGCGGMCGTTEHVKECTGALRRGYACIVSDRGHKGSSVIDTSWTGGKDMEVNLQALIDHGARSTHVTAVASKAVVQHFYRRSARTSYFMGCSAGGKAAMQSAQNFPWDFDGIAAGGPALRSTKVSGLWNIRAFNDTAGNPLLDKADIQLLHSAVVAACDLNDGIEDGLIGDPRQCGFKPQSLFCVGEKTSRCLNERQVKAVTDIYNGPITSTGVSLGPSSAALGSELEWGWFTGATANYFREIYRFFVFQRNPGATWAITDFDFDQDYKRFGLASLLGNQTNPDLRQFKDKGGKLLMYTGWNDTAEGVLDTVDYYETVERTMGGRDKTQEFYRLFVIPGMAHCWGGEGVYAIDFLKYLEDWVERNKPPDSIIGHHLTAPTVFSSNQPGGFGLVPPTPENIRFSRPIYPYPTQTQYLGTGDPNDAASFGPAKP